MKKENTKTNNKVVKVALHVLLIVITLVIGMTITAVRTGSEEEIAPALMEEYNVSSFDELINYGH